MSKDPRCLTQPQRRLGPGRRRSRAATAAAVALASILPSLLGAATVSAAAATLPPGAALPAAHAELLLQPPALSPGAQRAEMTPLIEDGRLAGAVWLEGGDRASFAVLYAAWKGTAWGAPRVVSAGG